MKFDYVTTHDAKTGTELFLVVNQDGEEIARCISEDMAIRIANAMNYIHRY